jgi:hypothetical protein
MTTPATPAAAAPAATPAAAVNDSLLPAEPAAPASAPPAAAAPAASTPATTPPAAAPAASTPATTPPADEAKWFYGDGTPGKGEPPSWYLADKYKTVEAQAQAYPELAKRFGAFVGAPKEGYKLELPADIGVTAEFDEQNPLLKGFKDWAATAQLSQQGFSQVLGMLAQYEAAQQPDMAQIKTEIGDNADGRLAAVAQWGKANLDPALYQDLRSSMSGANAAIVFKTVEAIVNKTRQPATPKPGADVVAAQLQGEAAIKAKMGERDANGQLKFMTDSIFRNEVEKQLLALERAKQPAVTV